MIYAVMSGLRDRLLTLLGSTLWPAYVRSHGVIVGTGTHFLGRPTIHKPRSGSIQFGKGCLVISRQDRNLLTQPCRFVLLGGEARTAEIRVGDQVGLSGVTVFCTQSVYIGANSIIGSDTIILDSDFHPIDPGRRLKDRNIGAHRGPVVIGENVFVGARVMILRDTTIGSGSVVGAGAVVCGSFPPNSMIVGNPSRVLRTLAPAANPDDIDGSDAAGTIAGSDQDAVESKQ